MPYTKTEWIDRVVDPATGDVVQPGTKFTATRANKIEQGIADAHTLVEALAKTAVGSAVESGLTFTSSGLTANWTAGVAYVNGVRFEVASGSIALNPTQGQYIYLDSDGAVKKTTSQATAQTKCLLWYFATDASGVITSTDQRKAPGIADGSVTDAKLGNRTVDQTTATPFANAGTLTQILSWFAKAIKAITGKTNWYDPPIKNMEQLNTDKLEKSVILSQQFHNLLRNGDFSKWNDAGNGALNWLLNNNSNTFGKETSAPYSKPSCGYYNKTSATASSLFQDVIDEAVVSRLIGKNITLSAMVKSQSTVGVTINLQFYNSANTVISTYISSPHSGSGNWEKLSVSAIVPAGTSYIRIYALYLNSNAVNGLHYADDAILSEGEIAVPFANNVLDYGTKPGGTEPNSPAVTDANGRVGDSNKLGGYLPDATATANTVALRDANGKITATGLPKIASGNYNGDNTTRTITVGFDPRLVFITAMPSTMIGFTAYSANGNTVSNGTTVASSVVAYTPTSPAAIKIVPNGFQVSTNGAETGFNLSSQTYGWVAIG